MATVGAPKTTVHAVALASWNVRVFDTSNATSKVGAESLVVRADENWIVTVISFESTSSIPLFVKVVAKSPGALFAVVSGTTNVWLVAVAPFAVVVATASLVEEAVVATPVMQALPPPSCSVGAVPFNVKDLATVTRIWVKVVFCGRLKSAGKFPISAAAFPLAISNDVELSPRSVALEQVEV